jgi:hypothetical protein
MTRGSWSEISSDSDIWKKIVLGGICLLTVLPLPIALGAVVDDLEAESKRIKEELPPGEFIDSDDFVGLLGRGLAPAFVLILALMLFCVPTVVLLMSAGHVYASFVSEHGMAVMSVLITGIFGLVALTLQFLAAIIFPISLAQYARGMNVKPAIHPLNNIGYAVTMGSRFWFKASGFWLFLMGNIVVYILGPAWYVNVPVQAMLAFLGYVSLIVSSRYALNELQNEL